MTWPHFQQCTCTAHTYSTFRLSLERSSYPAVTAFRALVLFSCVFFCNRARQETVEVFGDWVRDDTRCWRLWVLALLLLFTLLGLSRSHGRSAGRCRLDTRQRRLWRWTRVRVQIAQCLRRMMKCCLISYDVVPPAKTPGLLDFFVGRIWYSLVRLCANATHASTLQPLTVISDQTQSSANHRPRSSPRRH